MQLERTKYPARTVLRGTQEFIELGGKNLKMETTPQGQEILDEPIPAGKKWIIRVALDITEQDA